MSIRKLLQGQWLGHPLHPAMVHLPVGLFTATLVFDIASFSGAGGVSFPVLSFFAIGFGLLSGLAAAPAGLADWWDIKREKPAWSLGLWHMILNIALLVLFAINLIWRWLGGGPQAPVTLGPFILTIAGVVVLMISGYLGGRMVFDQGTSIARQSKQKWRKIAEAGDANLPPPS